MSTSTPSPNYARGRFRCRRLFTKEIQVTCLLRFVLRSLLFKRISDRTVHVSRAHWGAKGYYTLNIVSHGVLSECFYRTDMYAQHLSGPTINCTISTVALRRYNARDMTLHMRAKYRVAVFKWGCRFYRRTRRNMTRWDKVLQRFNAMRLSSISCWNMTTT